ncbi:aspartate kinase [Vibrio palustris]|uniref:Aspartokinase n=1 Tax=Vibrio palustris TaxID=1918946 RepID=A0A1R4B7X0_9VIBR|nr:aspartate kinase [Vibrio palustris]SJL85020.1 Aspartokinase [Vibrio palustris]
MVKPLIVQKFGGTSVGSIESIQKVAKHIIQAKEAGCHVVVVVSAMAGETNRLQSLADDIDAVPNARELDVLLSAGEQVSMALVAMMLNKLGYSASSLTGGQANIVTNDQYNNASILDIRVERIVNLLSHNHIVIVAGFQGVNKLGDITTLGRGGSDTSAVALAGALNAQECQIYTDVDGVYTSDPRIVHRAQKLAVVDFPSMKVMAQKGAKVLHLPSVCYAHEHKIPLRVLSTFQPGSGTLIKGDKSYQNVTGLAIQKTLTLVTLAPEFCDSVLKQCQLLGVEVWNVIREAEWAGVVIKQESCAKLMLVFSEKIRNTKAVSLLTMVGLQASHFVDAAFDCLSNVNIEICYTFTTVQALMLLLAPCDIEKAANVLHDAFVVFSDSKAQQSIFD